MVTCLTDEVVSLLDGLPDWQAAHDLMALLLILRGQQVPPHPEVHLHPLLDVLDKAVYPHCSPRD